MTHSAMTRAEQDQYILRYKGKKSLTTIGQELGLTRGQMYNRLRTLRKQQGADNSSGPTAGAITEAPTMSREESENAQVITSVCSEIKTLEDLLAHAEVDLSVWEVERVKINKWAGFARTTSRRVSPGKYVRDLTKLDLWQVTAHLKRKQGATRAEFRQQLIAEMKKHAPRYIKLAHPSIKSTDKHLLVISMPDLHMGRLSWGKETGEDYDIRIAAERYKQILEDLLARIAVHPIDQVCIPIGNDLLHVDTLANTTPAGTPQDTDTRWQKCFVATRELMTRTIERLSTIAPVFAPIVPGNHDTTRTFFIGDSLECQFSKSPHVRIDNSPTLRKYHRYNNTLLGFTHGSEEVHAELPNIMARERPMDWAEVVGNRGTTEWLLGHMHKRKEQRFNAADTFGGTVVRVIPSLAGTDAWHYRKGYVKGLCAGEAYLYHRTTGYAGHLTANAK